MKRMVLFVLVLLAALAPSASAADFSSTNLTPYLIINTRYFFVEVENPSAPTVQESNQFLTHGGAYFFTSSTRTGTAVPQSAIVQGIATARQLRAMRSRLNALNIRGMTSCEQIVNPAVQIVRDLVWYSVDGQRNAFTVVTGRGTTGLPSCPANVLEALNAINVLATQVHDNPGTEILTS